MKFELDYIEKLVNLVSDSKVTELILEDNERSIILKKEKEIVTVNNSIPLQPQVLQNAQMPVLEKGTSSTNIDTSAEPKTEEAPKGRPITSPMVGTFYKAASPDSPAFVNIGDMIASGQVVCIIEAMKTMNEIESEISGRVTKICVHDGQSVEYGQILMYVE